MSAVAAIFHRKAKTKPGGFVNLPGLVLRWRPRLIAPLIFISLIENAFKHGISPTERSFIHIHLAENDTEVICEISNSNHPKNITDKSGSGIGLEQVSRRLEILYPGQYTWQKGISEDGKEYKSRLSIRVRDRY